MTLKCRGNDPKKLKDSRAIKALPETSKRKYLITWNNFVEKYGIVIGKPPTEDDLYDFLESKFKAGYKSTTMRSNYSHLNLACNELYGERLKVRVSSLFYI